MLNLLAHLKEVEDETPEELTTRLNIALAKKYKSSTKSGRVVTSHEWTVTSKASDGSWTNYESLIAGKPRNNTRPVLGTMTVRVYHALPE